MRTSPDRKGTVQRRRKKHLICILVIVSIAGGISGCKKSETVESSRATNEPALPSVQHATTAQGAAPQTQPALTQSNSEPDLAELNRTLIRWIVANKRPPANFEDFAKTSGVQIPPPPAGKKYVVGKDMHIQLVNR
jgi:hypothetical protein